MVMLWAMHVKKRPKHGGFVLGRQKLWGERTEGHEKLVHSYFAENATFLSIVCIGVGRIVLPHSMDSLKATKRFHYNP
jgi:hypothetical protein